MQDLLSRPEFQGLEALGHVHDFSTAEYLFYEGDEASSICLLLSGSVAVLIEDEQGRELCVNILGPGEYLGELGLCQSEWRRSASVRARERTSVLEICYPDFLAHSQQNNELLLNIIKQLSHKLMEMTARARQFVHMTAQDRVLYVLRDLARRQRTETAASPEVLVSATKQEIANMAGCTRETVSRSLQELEAEGAIKNQGRKVLVKL